MVKKEENYSFPWGFHLGELKNSEESIPLYTPSKDGGFCLLYDKASEKKADTLLESLALELLASMPYQSLSVELFDFGKKKFYSLSPLQYVEIYNVAHNEEMINQAFQRLETMIISRHKELLCCNRQTINEHNQKSRMKQAYHLLLMNLENFPTEEQSLLRIENFVQSACQAGVYVIAFGNVEVEKSDNKTVQTILSHFKKLRVTENEFNITSEIFEFMELLDDHRFEGLDLDKSSLLQNAMTNANLESLMDPENIKLETNTKV